jgi:hypothetical protein
MTYLERTDSLEKCKEVILDQLSLPQFCHSESANHKNFLHAPYTVSKESTPPNHICFVTEETIDVPAEASENSFVISLTVIGRGVYCDDLGAPSLYVEGMT